MGNRFLLFIGRTNNDCLYRTLINRALIRLHLPFFKNSLAFKGCVAIFVCLLISAVPVSFAQTSTVQTESSVGRLTQGLLERVSFDIERFQVIGDNPLNDKDSNALLEPFIGKNKGIDDIEGAADAFEQAIIAKGFSFYQVSLPPQELTDNVVDILVKRYQIGKILVQGNKHYSDNNIIASLPKLKPGESPSTLEIARSLHFANQSPAKRVRVTLAPGQAADEIDAQVSVLDTNPLAMSVWLNNTGTEASGDYRVGASIAHSNLFDRDHSSSLSFITSPEGLNDVQQFALSYLVPFYQLGGKLNFLAVESDVDTGTVEGVFEVAGRGEVYSIGYTQVLATINNLNHQLSLTVDDKLFDNDVQFEGTQLLEDVRSRPVSLSYQANWADQNGLVIGGSIAASNNLSGGSFNNENSYLSSRISATNDWSKVDLSISFQYSLKGWMYSAAAKTSTSSDRLITGEQFAVGGSTSIRGMDERELRGDEGYQVNLQAVAPILLKTIQPSLFIDAGRVKNNNPIDGEFDSETVMSAGISFNWNPSNKISASASYGYLIDGIEETEFISNASQDGDSKLHFNLNYRF